MPTVKSKIIYPHLGIIDEVEEEIFEEGKANENEAYRGQEQASYIQ